MYFSEVEGILLKSNYHIHILKSNFKYQRVIVVCFGRHNKPSDYYNNLLDGTCFKSLIFIIDYIIFIVETFFFIKARMLMKF